MKAIVQDTYGSGAVLETRDIDKPEIGDGEVLVRVRAAGVTLADWAIMSGLPCVAHLHRQVNSIQPPPACRTPDDRLIHPTAFHGPCWATPRG